jgi:hypothetical protein
MCGRNLICKHNQVKIKYLGPCHCSDSSLLASHCMGPISIPGEICGGQSGTETHFFPGYLLSILFHQCSTLMFNSMLLSPERQTSEDWEPSKKQRLSEIGGTLDRKVLSFFFKYSNHYITIPSLLD